MILLEPGNRILEECLRSQICTTEKRIPMDVKLCDFDDVSYHVVIDKANLDQIKLSVCIPPFQKFKDKGGQAALDKYYKPFQQGGAETGYDFTLAVNCPNVKDPEPVIKNLSLVKSRITGGAFDMPFSALMEDKKADKFKFDLRSDTTVFLLPMADRVTVVFEVNFQVKMDQVIANVMLKEFVLARKNIGRAPPCTWDANPPSELKEFGVTTNKGCLGYMTFAILKSHLEKNKQEAVIAVLQTFRTYLQYHIKCSKSYFHSRMRKRVVELLKVLNRAKVPDMKKEKKTAGGKTFKRSV